MAVLAGCSSLRLAYNNGDTLLYWWIDGYVDLNATRRTGSRRYRRAVPLAPQDPAARLRANPANRAAPAAAGPTADLHNDYDDIKQPHRVLLLKAAPELADLARSLQAGPDRHAGAQVRRQQCRVPQKEYARRPEAQQKFRYQKSMEQFELWFGNFTREQEAQIRKASDARPLDNEIWLDERQRRQKNDPGAVRKVQQEKLSKDATVAAAR
jgi:hypothetical protein